MKEKTTAPVVDEVIDSAPEPKDKVEKSELDELKEQVESSKKEAERERIRAENAEREREEYSQKLSVESTERVKAQGSSVESMIAAKQSEAERLKKEIKDAHESGRFDDYAELVSDYTAAKQDIKNFETHKAQLEAQEEARSQAVKNDPLANYSPKERRWIQEHPQFLNDTRYQAKVTSAHYAAVAEGISPNTDDYFEYINNSLEPKEIEKDDTPPPKKVSTSIPPSRSGSSSTTSGQSKAVRLTAEEVEIAIMSYPKLTPADAQNAYHQNKLALIAEGKLN